MALFCHLLMFSFPGFLSLGGVVDSVPPSGPFTGDRYTCSWLSVNSLQKQLPSDHQRLVISSVLW